MFYILKLIIILAALSPLNCGAVSLGTLNITFAMLMGIDRMQTEQIVKSNNKFTENNLWLKDHHTIRDLNLYFGGVTVGAIVLSHVLPKYYGKLMMLSLSVAQFTYVTNNYSVGVRIKF